MRKPVKQITRRDIAAIHNFNARAFGKVGPEVPKARAPSRDLEHKEQVAVIQWWHLAHKQFGLPEFALFAVPNGGSRHMLTAVRLKAEGVRPGIPDLMLATPSKDNLLRGLFIEMKAKDGRESKEQIEVREFLNEKGYWSVVCYGAGEAMFAIQSYLRE